MTTGLDEGLIIKQKAGRAAARKKVSSF